MASLPQYEWDYRNLTREEVRVAYVYEYGREEPWVRESVASWRRKSLKEAPELQSFALEQCQLGPEDTVESLLCWLTGHSDFYRNRTLIGSLQKSMPPDLRYFFSYVAILCVEFPQAWNLIDPVRRNQLAEIVHDERVVPGGQLNPLFRGGIFPAITIVDDILMQHFRSRAYEITIHHGATKPQVRKALLAWLETLNLPPNTPSRRIGVKDHPKALKWLAAYKLSEKGIRFEKAEVLLKNELEKSRYRDASMLPMFADPPSWRKAIRNALERLEVLFS